MSCLKCHCVAIPDSDPQICPECLMHDAPKYNRVIVGIDDDELSLDEIVIIWFDANLDENNRRRDNFDAKQWSYHMTDFNDFARIDRVNGNQEVCLKGNTWHRWISWDEYVERLSTDAYSPEV